MKNYVFVYGTLMQGQGNHQWLGKNDTDHLCLGSSETIYPYRMVANISGIPAVLMANPVDIIKGELYAVTDRVMRHLDILESNTNVYQRVQVKVKRILGKSPVLAWLYFGIPDVWKKTLVVFGGNYRRPVNKMKGYIEKKKGGKSVRLVELDTDKPLTGWHRDRMACYEEFGRNQRRDRKNGYRSDRS